MITPLDPLFIFDRFIVGTGNRVAAAAARRASESPGRSYNPLVICGAAGLGKTHLLHAVGDRTSLIEPDLLIHYETVDDLGLRLDASAASGTVEEFQRRMNRVDLLLLDDLQCVAGKPRVQEEVLRELEAMVQTGAQVVITSNRAIQEIPALDARLATRLAAGLMLDIAPPDAETRRAIIRQLLAERGARIDEDVLDALVRLRIENVRELQDALDSVLAIRASEERSIRPAEVAELVGLNDAHDPPAGEFDLFLSDLSTELASMVETIAPAPIPAPPVSSPDDWFLDREKFAWQWLSLDERIVEEQR